MRSAESHHISPTYWKMQGRVDPKDTPTLERIARETEAFAVETIMLRGGTQRRAAVVLISRREMAVGTTIEEDLVQQLPARFRRPNREEGDGDLLMVLVDHRQQALHTHTFDPTSLKAAWRAKNAKPEAP